MRRLQSCSTGVRVTGKAEPKDQRCVDLMVFSLTAKQIRLTIAVICFKAVTTPAQ